jgi:N-glycosylase/DNA lyase
MSASTDCKQWVLLEISAEELRCSTCLNNGQCFQWKPIKTNEWIGAIDQTIVVLQELENDTAYCLPTVKNEDNAKWKQMHQRLHDYFNIHLGSVQQHIQEWSRLDPYFAKRASCFTGLRLLCLDPLECLLSFICSSNNHISRIHKMVDSLRKEYGTYLGTVENQPIYSFPSFQQLKQVTEEKLRQLGFGYRASYLVKTIQQLKQLGGESYLINLKKNPSSDEKVAALQEFYGVGKKVAELTCLQSLGGYDCIPVDVHILRVYNQKYNNGDEITNLSPNAYSRIKSFFQQRFGPLAGWCQSFLFTDAREN